MRARDEILYVFIVESDLPRSLGCKVEDDIVWMFISHGIQYTILMKPLC